MRTKGKERLSLGFCSRFKNWFAPLHPTWQSKQSKDRSRKFLFNEQLRAPNGLRLNVGSASRRFDVKTINIDLFAGEEVDIQGDLLYLPIKNESVDAIICTGVLEHVSDPHQAVMEICRVLKCAGRVFIETPFMQTVHASPMDFYRWTPDGLRQLMKNFDILEIKIVAGPASALAWMVQQTLAMLFSLKNESLYKAGLRIFGLLAVPVSWLDALLEKNPMAWRAASGFSILAVKNPT
jgi:SAM-dependent methyltransferase